MINIKTIRLLLRLSYLIILVIGINSCHIPKALWYQKAGIYDYANFNNRIINNEKASFLNKSSLYNSNNIPISFLSDFETYKTTAYLVMQNDSLLFEKYWLDGGPDVLSNSFSMAKSIVGLLVGFALDDGYIKSLDDYVYNYLPGFEKNGKEMIKIKHLLTMSSGIKWNENYAGLFSNMARAYYGRNIKKQMMNLEMSEQPGINCKYQSCDTQILSLIIEKVSGKTVSEYLSEKLWKQIGAEHYSLWSTDRKNGNEKSFCCISAVARDFLRLGILCINSGNWNGNQIINSNYINDSFTAASYLNNEEGESVNHYGYQWWILHYKGLKINMAIGYKGQYIIMIPEKNTIIVRLGHARNKAVQNRYTVDLYTYIDAALEIIEH